MMTEEQAIKLGRRAVAAGWRVWPGALSMSGTRCTLTPIPLRPRADDIPDFRDPATLGILRAQVVALVPGAVDVSCSRRWLTTMDRAHRVSFVDNDGYVMREIPFAITWNTGWHIEALVAALEAAKEHKP